MLFFKKKGGEVVGLDSKPELPPEFETLLREVLRVLTDLISEQRGNVMTFTSKIITRRIFGVDSPRLKLRVSLCLFHLVEQGLVEVYKRRPAIKFMVTSKSPLWRRAKRRAVACSYERRQVIN